MSLEIDNSYSYSKPNEKCPMCGEPLNIRVVFHNVPANCEEHITYPFMQIGQSMHMECYLEHAIDTILKKKMGNIDRFLDNKDGGNRVEEYLNALEKVEK